MIDIDIRVQSMGVGVELEGERSGEKRGVIGGENINRILSKVIESYRK